ncbi:FecR domain-containing protein [Endozoicomonadaceae bacterium StTr2]
MNNSNPSPESIRQAACWAARLWADDATEQDRQALLHWRQQNSDNDNAWRHLEQVQSKFSLLPSNSVSTQILGKRTRINRRQLLALAILSLGATGLYRAHLSRTSITGEMFSSNIGEIKPVTLTDGTRLVLNTDSKLIANITSDTRQLHLLQGEVMITTGSHPAPLQVFSTQGQIIPIGTRFAVQQHEQSTRVEVYKGAVTLSPLQQHITQTLQAGEFTHFTTDQIDKADQLPETNSAWTQQLLVASRMPLTVFTRELARYRPGFIRIDPELEQLHVTGVFSLQDTDQILHNLSQILPVKITYLTRYWITISSK